MLAARSHVRMGFRVFDPLAPLHSEAGRAAGRDWFDLVVHTLSRRVRIELTPCDLDPVVASAIHRRTWRSIRILIAAAEVAGPEARLSATAAMHPARVPRIPKLVFHTRIRGELRIRSA